MQLNDQECNEIAALIDAFDEECASTECTDTGEVWDILNRIRSMVKGDSSGADRDDPGGARDDTSV